MIKYHGTPITPISVFNKLAHHNVLIPFSRRDNFKQAIAINANIMIDND